MIDESSIDSIEATRTLVMAAKNALYEALRQRQSGPEICLAEMTNKRTGKSGLRIDNGAEDEIRSVLELKLGNKIVIIGEESLVSTDTIMTNLVPHGSIAALIDPIDGTDLLELGIENWCCAGILFDPHVPAILGSVIAQANGDIFFASTSDPDAKVWATKAGDSNETIISRKMRGPGTCKEFNESVISFYGQKINAFRSLSKFPKLEEKFTQMEKAPPPNFRLHTLSGNPMMVRLADRAKMKDGKNTCKGIDLLFSLRDQFLHDVVPGMFIAMKAGAHAYLLDGTPITYTMLAEKLLQPGTRMKYVLSSTPELAKEFLSYIN
ncbi:hypothetical protein UNDKW_5954 (plasmid) [Undibacterium sp. KW1]|uniref:hypothetical protein n=1 Tax=Undibacterium sp. KW1 TaxID=2058624 RepID=UPI001331D97E|nr:hypothetical protein [Undibacterium sp. KW1]BBB64227.1 hypothetical protein UNDKW_5954 [Undibacterium sp. KW1]